MSFLYAASVRPPGLRLPAQRPLVHAGASACGRGRAGLTSFAPSDKCAAWTSMIAFSMHGRNSLLRIYTTCFAVGASRGVTRGDCYGTPSAPGRLLSLGCLRFVGFSRFALAAFLDQKLASYYYNTHDIHQVGRAVRCCCRSPGRPRSQARACVWGRAF